MFKTLTVVSILAENLTVLWLIFLKLIIFNFTSSHLASLRWYSNLAPTSSMLNAK